MSSTYEEASRFADYLDGFDLVAYEPVGIPAFVVTLEVIVQKKKPIPPIDEFALRMVNGGLSTLEGVSGLLGLEARLTEASILNQLQAGTLVSQPAPQGGRTLEVTPRGDAAIMDLAGYMPERQEIYVVYDRVTRTISGTDDRGLLRPHELECRSLRARTPVGPPRLEDVPVDDVAAALAKSEGLRRVRRNANAEFQVVGVKRVARSERRYKRATLLVYRERRRGILTFGVVIDGRPSKPHIAAVQELGGLDYLEIPKTLLTGRRHHREAIAAIPASLRGSVSEGSETQESLRSFVRAWRRLRDPDVTMDPTAGERTDRTPRGLAQAAYIKAGTELQRMAVRVVPAWEHGLLLEWAISTARRHVVLASALMTDSAVSYDLLRRLEGAVARGVSVSVVIPPNTAGQKNIDGRSRLVDLAGRRERLTVVESSNARSLLLWDDSWVAGTFPWLGHTGDPEQSLINHESVVIHDRASAATALQDAMTSFGVSTPD
jgi:hypothetical protein